MYKLNKKAIGAISLTLVISLLTLGSTLILARAFPPEDVNQDGTVDMKDVTAAVAAFNSIPGSTRYNHLADVNGDGRKDM